MRSLLWIFEGLKLYVNSLYLLQKSANSNLINHFHVILAYFVKIKIKKMSVAKRLVKTNFFAYLGIVKVKICLLD